MTSPFNPGANSCHAVAVQGTLLKSRQTQNRKLMASAEEELQCFSCNLYFFLLLPVLLPVLLLLPNTKADEVQLAPDGSCSMWMSFQQGSGVHLNPCSHPLWTPDPRSAWLWKLIFVWDSPSQEGVQVWPLPLSPRQQQREGFGDGRENAAASPWEEKREWR